MNETPAVVERLWISTFVDYFAARWIASQTQPGPRRLALIISLAANLGFLGYFKYGAFLTENRIGGTFAAFGCSSLYQFSFEFRQATKNCQHQSPGGGRGIGPLLRKRHKKSAAVGNRFKDQQ